VLQNWAVPPSLRAHRDTLTELAEEYKQINASVGELGLATLRISTKALKSNTSGDSTYITLENKLARITDQRNALADQISDVLENAEFNNQPINEQQAKQLIQQADDLLDQVEAMA
jgi:hypothetical protein